MSELLAEMGARRTEAARTAIQRIALYAGTQAGGDDDRTAVDTYVIQHWLSWCLGDDMADLAPVNPGRLYTDQDGIRLIYQERDRYSNPANTGNTRHMALLLGKRGENPLILLNGDGFDIRGAARCQEMLRDQARQAIGEPRVMLVPWMALHAMSVNLQSMEPIDVTADTEATVRHIVPAPPPWDRDDWIRNENARRTTPAGPQPEPSTPIPDGTETWEIRHENTAYRLVVSNGNPYQWMVWGTTLEGGGPSQWFNLDGTVEHRHISQAAEWGYDRDVTEAEVGMQFWTENRHMLGAVVFSARLAGTSKKRHRFISAFDQNEAQALYFLSELPEKAEVKTYEDALNLLCPPIIHEARAEGRIVERQGDVFLMETPLTSEQVYDRARKGGWRVRREVAMFDLPTRVGQLANGDLDMPVPAAGEVTDEIDCPCGIPSCTGKVTIGCGPTARRALSIYRTGHTADEVVVLKDGTTFVRGRIYHDPQLETPGRVADHAVRALGSDPEVWFLAVRNTVPQAHATPTDVNDSLVDTYLTVGVRGHKTRRTHRRSAEKAAEVRRAEEASQVEEQATAATREAALV